MTTQLMTPSRRTVGTTLASILRFREFPVTLALVLLVLITYVLNPRFISGQGVKDLLLNATIVMILAAGQAVVIITRNVDLSVGSILGISGFMTGTLLSAAGGTAAPEWMIPIVFIVGILLGGALGAINGLLVSTLRVPALVITLGTLYIYRGINNAWAGGKEYFDADRPKAFAQLSVNTFLGFPLITLAAVVVIIVLAIALARTRAGRDLYAIGSDPDAARLFGIPVGKRVFSAFLINGLLAGLGGVLWASRFSSVGASTGTGLELQVVAGAVVGGVAIFGGSGSVAGAGIGALLLTTIGSALTAVGIGQFWLQAIVGVLIIAAIVVDRVASLRKAARLRRDEARDV
jgi:rhamnose transport system permease protein